MRRGEAAPTWREVEALRARLALADRDGGLTPLEHALLQAEYDRRRAVLAAHRVRVVSRERDGGWLLWLDGRPGAGAPPGAEVYEHLPDGRRLRFAYESQALDYAWYVLVPRVAPRVAHEEGLLP